MRAQINKLYQELGVEYAPNGFFKLLNKANSDDCLGILSGDMTTEEKADFVLDVLNRLSQKVTVKQISEDEYYTLAEAFAKQQK